MFGSISKLCIYRWAGFQLYTKDSNVALVISMYRTTNDWCIEFVSRLHGRECNSVQTHQAKKGKHVEYNNCLHILPYLNKQLSKELLQDLIKCMIWTCIRQLPLKINRLCKILNGLVIRYFVLIRIRKRVLVSSNFQSPSPDSHVFVAGF